MPTSTSAPGSACRATSTGAPSRRAASAASLGRRDPEDHAALARLVRRAVELDDHGCTELLGCRRRFLGRGGAATRRERHAEALEDQRRLVLGQRSARRRAGRRRRVPAGGRRRGLEGASSWRRQRGRASRRGARAAARRRARARAPGSGAAGRRCAPSSSHRRGRSCSSARRASVRSVSSHHSSFVRSRNCERSACATRTSNSPDSARSSSERG